MYGKSVMQINLHKNARTTPAIRREIQSSSLSASQLAAKHGIGKVTALKWKNRDSIEDRLHTPHRFNKTMSDLEEFVVIELRKSLLLPLDDLLAIVREFINPKGLALRTRPLSAPTWRRQPEGVDGCRRGRAQAQKEL